MKRNISGTFFFIVAVLVLLWVAYGMRVAEANGPGSYTPKPEPVQVEGGHVGDVDARATATAVSTADSTSSSASTVTTSADSDINIAGDVIPADTTHKGKLKVENTADIVNITPGSGDECKAHVGATGSIPGLAVGFNIPLPGRECRKLQYYDRMIAAQNYDAAAIIFCSLVDVEKEFKELNLDCQSTINPSMEPPEDDQIGMWVPREEYEELLLAQVQQEEFEEAQQMDADRFAQQENRIDSLEDELSEREAALEELERIKAEAAELKRREEARKAAELNTKTKLQALYDKRASQVTQGVDEDED
jgi:hypothetical protein